MIRLTFLLRRKTGMQRSEFQDYWLNQHGPLIAGIAGDLKAMRYIQVHTLDDDFNDKLASARGGAMEQPYDGVAELWWRTMDDLEQSTRSEAARAGGAALLADEDNFLDMKNSCVWFGYEYPQVNPVPECVVARPRNNVVKLYFPLRHPPSMTAEAAKAYWHQSHGPLIRSHAGASGILRYLQVHRIEHPLEDAFRKVRGIEVEPYTGHAELWIERQALTARHPESRAAALAAIEDEKSFIDFSRSAIWIGKEHVMVDHFNGN